MRKESVLHVRNNEKIDNLLNQDKSSKLVDSANMLDFRYNSLREEVRNMILSKKDGRSSVQTHNLYKHYKMTYNFLLLRRKFWWPEAVQHQLMQKAY